MTNYATSQASFTRPADTTQYASGDLIANSTTAGSVAMMQFNFPELGARRSGKVVGVRTQKSTNAATAATFRVHLFRVVKTLTNGDNGALVVNSMDGYVGSIDVDMSSGALLIAGANIMSEHSAAVNYPFRVSGQVLYGLLEARGTYTPASAEVFTVDVLAEF